MIGKLISTLVVMAVGGALTWYALAHHVVTTDTGRVFVPKLRLGYEDTLVNVTAWTAEDWAQHPQLIKAMVKAGRDDLVTKSASDSITEWVKDKAGDILKRDENGK